MPTPTNINRARLRMSKQRPADKLKKEAEKVSADFFKEVQLVDRKYMFLGTILDELDAAHRANPDNEHDHQVLKVYEMYEELNSAMSDIHSGAHDLQQRIKKLRI